MKFFANYAYNVLPILGVVLALLAMATVHPVRADWRKVPTDKQQINMQVPGMEHWNPGYWKKVDDNLQNEGTGYYTKWRLIKSYGIHAYLTYQIRMKRFYYVSIKDLADISIDYAITFEGSEKTYDSKRRKFKYIYFSINTESVKRKCVGFGNLSSSRKKVIYGHYCLSGDEPIDDAIVGPLIDSIDLGSDPD